MILPFGETAPKSLAEHRLRLSWGILQTEDPTGSGSYKLRFLLPLIARIRLMRGNDRSSPQKGDGERGRVTFPSLNTHREMVKTNGKLKKLGRRLHLSQGIRLAARLRDSNNAEGHDKSLRKGGSQHGAGRIHPLLPQLAPF